MTWADVRLGALLAAILFEAGKYAFSWYLTGFARYSLIYGSLGTTIVFLVWTYLVRTDPAPWRRADRRIRPPAPASSCQPGQRHCSYQAAIQPLSQLTRRYHSDRQ